ncbi:hypothetical protein MBRA1_001986 [Malassezia brasiliensis]|uniref:Cytochrome b5 heme-binding domain-containing protein n=1 Tax=Malassezia brasiliensis TaxID=1821822 RepID=A0AAF0INQ0_9BASI|nr:hypothetical protein MBRA1_001986 [Malassezia brasiliensis]
MALREITFEEFCKHNKENDLWLLIDGKVYDVTKFLPEHPGGEEVLITEAGKDATEPFEDVGHSEDAREDLKKMLIGVIADPENVPKTGRAAEGEVQSSGGPPLIVIFAVTSVVAYYLYKRYMQ